MLDAQQLQKVGCSGMIVAQKKTTALELHRMSANFALQLPLSLPEPTKEEILFPHSKSVSRLAWATAKTAAAGRGQTVNGLLLSESSRYPDEQSWISLLNMVSRTDRDNIVVVETTPNGMSGPGETYFNYWNDAVEGKNDFFPIFLPWWDDPSTFLPESLAPDAPKDDYEKWLMKDFKITKGQIAWHRDTLNTLCAGNIYKWREEYPASPSEAFIGSGDPAFDFSEIETARRTCCDPIAKMRLAPVVRKVDWAKEPKKVANFEEVNEGPLWIWEFPKPDTHYYAGLDAAKGIEVGDFAAIVGWNAETGEQAFRFSAKYGPEVMAAIANHLGRWYNNCVLNIEETGGWGWIVIRDLRDAWHYPAQYMWMGQNDRPDRKPRQALGWVMTQASRARLFDNFRASLRTPHPTISTVECKGNTYDRMEFTIRDIELVQQMNKATMQQGWRWKIEKGHDDIFIAAGLGWVACKDHHFPHNGERRVGSTMKEQESKSMPNWLESAETTAFGILGWSSTQHLSKLNHYQKMKNKRSLLEGI